MKGDRFTSKFGAVAKVALVSKAVLVVGSVTLLGAACWKGVGTNTNVGALNGNASVNENVDTVAGNINVEVNTNAGVNTNANTNSTGEVDTSDWLTYISPEYGFTVKYPKDWVVFNEISRQDGQLILDEENLSYLRFTSQENNPAPEAGFIDISMGVKPLEYFNEIELTEREVGKVFVYKGEQYVVGMSASTWAGGYELKVLAAMYDSITF